MSFGIIAFDKRCSRRFSLCAAIILGCIISFFGGIREIGYDYETYLDHFQTTQDITHYTRNIESMEIGYELMISILKVFSNHFHVFLLFFTSLTILIAFKLYWKYSPLPIVSFLMFCALALFGQVYGQMRQPFAILVAYSLILPLLLSKKRILATMVCVVVGFLFHRSLLMLAPFLLIVEYTYKKQWFIAMSCLALFVYLFAFNLASILQEFFSDNSGDNYIFLATHAYLTYKSYTLSFSMGMIERVCMTFLLLYYASKDLHYKNNILLRICVNTYFFGTLLYFSFISISAEFASRGTFAFSYIALSIAIPMLIKFSERKDKIAIASVVTLWAFYLFLKFLLTIEAGIYYPYKSVII